MSPAVAIIATLLYSIYITIYESLHNPNPHTKTQHRHQRHLNYHHVYRDPYRNGPSERGR
ncbi:hypothetical protein BDD12DRAFT_839205 [Trichophaea hybrida]|nr:hypothetical protein BDD12DRAFT_839205 [Trichophaea hybrida]